MKVNFTNFDEVRISSNSLKPLWAFTIRKRKLLNHIGRFQHVYEACLALLTITIAIGGFSLFSQYQNRQTTNQTADGFIQPVDQTPQPSSSAIAIGGNPLSSWNTYTNSNYDVTLQYPPEFFTACCFADSPFAELADSSVSFATKPKSVADLESITSFTLYIIPNKQKQTFETFVRTQKQNLIAIGKVVTKGTPPKSEQTINSNDQTGYILHGYLHNADVAVLPTPTNAFFLVVVARPAITSDQANRFYTILSTMQ